MSEMGGHLVLVGMMGVGKSTVGRIVADRMQRPFFDSDAEVERRCKRSIPAVFATNGEAAFRSYEREAVCCLLASRVPAVISLGGGAVIDPETRRRLGSGNVVVWLELSADALALRLGDGAGRPLIEGDPVGALRRLDAMRRPIYRNLAAVAVPAGSRSAPVVAEAVLRAALGRLKGPCGASR
ncbi:MAG: shikimate kinase [Acidimicrobiales bacterium]|jgi:shikimate kinase